MSNISQNESSEKKSEKVVYIRGWAFPKISFFPSKNIIEALDYRHLDGDIVMCTYPKTGSTWTQYIVWQILHKGESFPTFHDATHHLIPFMEMSGMEAVKALKEPRFYKNHFPYHLMAINDKAKYIYVYRDPSDTLASFYHFEPKVTGFATEFDEYFERFMTGEVSYGDYFDHVLSFYAHKDDPNLLLLSYEDLHSDKRGQILRIAKFLGDNYHEMLLEDETLMQKIIEVTSFDYMKKNLTLTVPSENGEKKIDFFRKGIVGDGKNLLSEQQQDRLHRKMLEKMKGTKFVDIWSRK